MLREPEGLKIRNLLLFCIIHTFQCYTEVSKNDLTKPAVKYYTPPTVYSPSTNPMFPSGAAYFMRAKLFEKILPFVSLTPGKLNYTLFNISDKLFGRVRHFNSGLKHFNRFVIWTNKNNLFSILKFLF